MHRLLGPEYERGHPEHSGCLVWGLVATVRVAMNEVNACIFQYEWECKINETTR